MHISKKRGSVMVSFFFAIQGVSVGEYGEQNEIGITLNFVDSKFAGVVAHPDMSTITDTYQRWAVRGWVFALAQAIQKYEPSPENMITGNEITIRLPKLSDFA